MRQLRTDGLRSRSAQMTCNVRAPVGREAAIPYFSRNTASAILEERQNYSRGLRRASIARSEAAKFKLGHCQKLLPSDAVYRTGAVSLQNHRTGRAVGDGNHPRSILQTG
jgi:hypothetical protein